MNLLIATDKFKGSLTALEVCESLGKVLQERYPKAQIIYCPLADGGDGSLALLASYLKMEEQSCMSQDPLGRAIKSKYFTLGNRAYIELAATSGLTLLNPTEYSPFLSSTEGTGIQIKHAIENGSKEIVLFLGGSATNDAGLGIARVLGFRYIDDQGNDLNPIGANLIKVHKIISSKYDKLKGVNFTLLCDVNNPMYGSKGAAQIYAKQKGASLDEILQLDKGLKNLSQIFCKDFNKDISEVPGAGAAGGTAAGLSVLLDAKIHNGFEFIADLVSLQTKIRVADFVITGEGKLDKQSLSGKVISGLSRYCKESKVPLLAVTGKNELSLTESNRLSLHKVYSITDLANNEKDAIENAKAYLREIGKKMVL